MAGGALVNRSAGCWPDAPVRSTQTKLENAKTFPADILDMISLFYMDACDPWIRLRPDPAG
jgi:hypothetical protein